MNFKNEQIAALMNDLFISIKVDREERPDFGRDLYECGAPRAHGPRWLADGDGL